MVRASLRPSVDDGQRLADRQTDEPYVLHAAIESIMPYICVDAMCFDSFKGGEEIFSLVLL